MATTIKVFEDDFNVAEKIEPVQLAVNDYKIEDYNTHKGILKLTLSIAYFVVLVYFLFKLLA